MKTLEQAKEWYISAVKATLVLNFNVLEDEAERAIDRYGLKQKIEDDPEGELEGSIDGVAEDIARKEFVGRPNQLTYKGFFTEVRYDSRLRHLYGRVYGIDDFVSFEAESVDAVESEFHKAVDDYLAYKQEKDVPISGNGLSDGAGTFDTLEARLAGFRSLQEVNGCAGIFADEDSDSCVAETETGVDRNSSAHSAGEGTQKGKGSRQALEMNDEDFLRYMGIEPDELSAAAYNRGDSQCGEIQCGNDTTSSAGTDYSKGVLYSEEEVTMEDARNKINGMSDGEFLKFMGIDPDEVIL